MTEAEKLAIPRIELYALLAMLSATIAFSIDAMLPALPDIASELSADDPNRVQLVIATFVLGMGLGTFVSGPLSDAYGRHSVAVGGAALYIVGALVSAISESIELLLIARFFQGLGAAGPRVVAMAITRDLFSGRQMAKIVSLIMTVFTLVPVFAPPLGAAINWAFGWRAIFVSFAVFSIVSMLWLTLRLHETHPPEKRRPFRPAKLWEGFKEIITNGYVTRAMSVQILVFSMLFVALMTSQQLYDEVFGRGDSFPFWFGAVAAVSAFASILNAAIVMKFGMHAVVRVALSAQFALSAGYLLILLTTAQTSPITFVGFVIWQITIFSMAGFGIGNLNAIAMEPLGHIAGMAASLMSAISTIVAIVIAVPIAQAFDGTPRPAVFGALICCGLGLATMWRLREPELATD
ncbi:MAG: multidrug effflux MFS transporter [Boseongicola sp.]|nr:multidrug effflux MFS transporter [Boseongicola sp.]